MSTKVPEASGDDVVITPETSAQQPSRASPEENITPQPSQPPAYPPPYQPIHENTDQPTQQPKRYEDILAHEDKEIDWDGPVWRSRYGRVENQEDAATNGGYKSIGQVHPTDLELQRCEKHGCDCRAPFQHRFYVQDIQRRIEPMVESLIRLESQVGKLIHHATEDGESMLHHNHNHNHHPHPNEHVEHASKHETSKHPSSPPDASREPSQPSESLLDAAYRLRYEELPHSGRHQSRELPETGLDRLAHRVESLMEQVQHLLKKN